jgi:hypothetical protein
LSLITLPQIYLSYDPGFAGQVLTSGGAAGAAYWGSAGGGSMLYPGAGIPLSTGSAWGTSITNNSANWNTAYGWGNWASNFGSTTGTITQGNDSRLSDARVSNISPSTSGNLMTSNGSVWTSAAPPSSISGNAGTVTVAANTTNATYYPLFVTSATGSLAPQTTAAKLTFNPSTGVLVSTNFQLSDRRLKNNIKPLDQFDYAKIAKIEFRKFYMNDDPTNKQHFGVIAQDVERVFPEFVNTDEKGMKSVNYTEILLLKIAELEERIKILEKK